MNEEEENDTTRIEDTKNISNYLGAIIGGIIAFLLCLTNFYTYLLYVVIILVGIFVGNYIQKNKDFVKIKLKEFIDKV